MINAIAFVIPGEPQGKGRARVGTINGKARMFTPGKTVAYEGLIAHEAQQAMRGGPLLEGPCALEVDAVYSVPASWSQKKRAQALAHYIRPTKKPDADNVLKAVCDGMNGVVWKDDVQAVYTVLRKTYGPTPGVRVRVAALDAASPQGELIA